MSVRAREKAGYTYTSHRRSLRSGMAIALVYIPQPDLRGHFIVVELAEEPKPGIYNEVVHVHGHELHYTRGSLVDMLSFREGYLYLWRELEPYLPRLKYLVIRFQQAHFTRELTIIAPVDSLDKVKVSGGVAVGEEICVDLPDKYVCVSYRWSDSKSEPKLLVKDKFEAVVKQLGLEEVKVNLSDEAKAVVEEATKYANSELDKLQGLPLNVDREHIKKLYIMSYLLDRISILELDYANIKGEIRAALKKIRSEEARQKIEAALEELDEKVRVASQLATFLLSLVRKELKQALQRT